MIDNGHIGDLAGPYAVGACSPDEEMAVAEHVSSCPACATEIDTLSRTAELIGEAAARPPSPGLRSRVLAAAFTARPGRSEVRRLSDIYRTQVAELDRLLADLPPTQWQNPCQTHSSVRAMLLHLTENDRQVAATAGVGARAGASDVRASWRTQALAISETVGRAGGDLMERDVRLAGRRAVRRPMREALIQRGFETWIHAEDVRVVLELPPQRPDGRQIADIVGFALPLLPAAMAAAGNGRAIRLVLTGDGGRTDVVGDGDVVAEISLPAERFCRLLAGRLTPDATGAEIGGDTVAARGFLTVAATMGCD
ncbi:uncharacterized protein (TIGR03083 family) [Actinoplanes lutulentus]|uniref:Uncharacterized protein (TIGR03083 family) n=1 Tax=Actinoplanes lutulentus TaxID=1287878 RepID=A0A327Z973_9ACTN|nr:maleylpyruvate isomerase family mycothiol-dependent enzyme [Actinoplanes lutulentus]MBB2946672.1 uncharacterized protein (TIGR03083 family) [Actinoplanes lutulentus]RAK35565.1 uncharacterized protein (TIGR03083 family) [Actinoplanes lutulentus]